MLLKAVDKHAGFLTVLWTLAGYLASTTYLKPLLHLDYRLVLALTLPWLGIWLMLAIAAVRRGNRFSSSCISVTALALLLGIFSIFTGPSGYRYSGPGNWYPEIPAGAPILTLYASSPVKAESVRFHRRAEGFIHLLGLRTTKLKGTNAYPPWFSSDYKDDNVAVWSTISEGKSGKGPTIFGAGVTLAPHNTNYSTADFERLAAKLEEFVKYNNNSEVHVTWRIATGDPRKTPTQTTAQK